jgi:hypothetical protein
MQRFRTKGRGCSSLTPTVALQAALEVPTAELLGALGPKLHPGAVSWLGFVLWQCRLVLSV